MKQVTYGSYFLIAIIMVLTWRFFGAWSSIFARSWLWIGFVLLYGITVEQGFFRSKQFLFLLVYLSVIILNYFSGDAYFDNPIQIVFEIMILAASCVGAFYFLKDSRFRSSKILLTLTLGMLVFVSLASFIIDQKYPGIIREIQFYLNAGSRPPIAIMERYGLSNYELPHAIPVLIPPLVCLFKQNATMLRMKFVYAAIILLCFLLTYVSGATTPFLFVLFFAIISGFVIPGGASRRNVILYVLMGIFIVLILDERIFLFIIGTIAGFTDDSLPIYERMMDLESSVYTGAAEGDFATRTDLYTMSINSFLNNIIIGSNSNIGGHSVLLDRLGALGLAGFIPYVLFIWTQLKCITDRIPTENRVYYFLSIIAALSMLATKNMSNWPLWCFLFIIAPIMLRCVDGVAIYKMKI